MDKRTKGKEPERMRNYEEPFLLFSSEKVQPKDESNSPTTTLDSHSLFHPCKTQRKIGGAFLTYDHD